MQAPSEEQARAILRDYYSAEGPDALALAKRYGVHPSTVTRLVAGTIRPSLPRPFKVSAIAPPPPRWNPPTLNQARAAVLLALDTTTDAIAQRLGLNATNLSRLLANRNVHALAQALREQDVQVVQIALLSTGEHRREVLDLLTDSTHPVAEQILGASKQPLTWMHEIDLPQTEERADDAESPALVLLRRPIRR